jgi:hypothetical protein
VTIVPQHRWQHHQCCAASSRQGTAYRCDLVCRCCAVPARILHQPAWLRLTWLPMMWRHQLQAAEGVYLPVNPGKKKDHREGKEGAEGKADGSGDDDGKEEL